MTNEHIPTIQIALVNANLVGAFVQFLIRAPALKILPLGVARAKNTPDSGQNQGADGCRRSDGNDGGF